MNLNSSEFSLDDFAIVILSFDGYSDLWEYFFKFFNMYWPDCPYKLYLVTNNKDVDFNNVIVIKTGDEISWSNRTRIALSKISAKYVLLLLEDYFIGKEVSNHDFNKIVAKILLNKYRYYRLNRNPPPRGRIDKSINAYEINENEEYGINLQPALWNKDFLINLLGNGNYSAWEFEINQLKKTYVLSKKHMEGCYVDNSNVFIIYNGVLKGKWIPGTLKYYRNQGSVIDPGNRAVLKASEEWNHIVRTYIRNHIPYWARKVIKKLMTQIGVKFVTKY